MRGISSALIVFSFTVILCACGEEAAINAHKTAVAGGRQEVVVRLAHATEDAGDLAGAEKLYLQMVEQNRDSTSAHIELADFYKRHHQDEKAIASLNAALKLNPDNADIERSLANTYINAAEPEKALPVLDNAISTHKNDALLYNSRGVALDQIGNYREAQNSYKKAFETNPAEGTMYKINLSMSYIMEGSYANAVSLLRPMLDSPDSPPIVRQNLALAYGLKGDTDSALKLGLQDLSTSEAEENVRFYRMLALKHQDNPKTANLKTVPSSVIQDIFPEKELPDTQNADMPSLVHENSVNTSAAVETFPVKPIKPVAHKTAKALPQIDDDEADDDNETMESPVIPVSVPAATMSQAPAMTVSPDQSPLPEPVLKPDSF